MRKLLSVLTVLAIILCLMTTVAFAEDKYLLIGSGGITVADDKYTYGNDNGVIAGYENVDMQDTLPEVYACRIPLH